MHFIMWYLVKIGAVRRTLKTAGSRPHVSAIMAFRKLERGSSSECLSQTVEKTDRHTGLIKLSGVSPAYGVLMSAFNITCALV